MIYHRANRDYREMNKVLVLSLSLFVSVVNNRALGFVTVTTAAFLTLMLRNLILAFFFN
jgi:hypothetical protein